MTFTYNKPSLVRLMKQFSSTITRSLFLTLLVFVMTGLSACFREPTPIGTEIPESKPFGVSTDSMSFQVIDNDDINVAPHHQFVLSNRATIAGTRDSSYIVIDTTGGIPKLSARIYLTPKFDDDNDAKDCKLRQIILALDSEAVLGEDWKWLNAGQIALVVRTAEKPTPVYSRVRIIQPGTPPFAKDESYARIFAWKVTAKRQIVFQVELQAGYAVQYQSRQAKDRMHAVGEFRIRY